MYIYSTTLLEYTSWYTYTTTAVDLNMLYVDLAMSDTKFSILLAAH
jgi:hypothetical protein